MAISASAGGRFDGLHGSAPISAVVQKIAAERGCHECLLAEPLAPRTQRRRPAAAPSAAARCVRRYRLRLWRIHTGDRDGCARLLRRGSSLSSSVSVPASEQPGEDAALRLSGGLGVCADHAGSRAAASDIPDGIVAAALDIGQRQRIAGKRMAVGRNMHRAAVGKDLDQLIVRHARPVADRAGIEMDEGRAGGRIEADAAALQPQADVAHFSSGTPGMEKSIAWPQMWLLFCATPVERARNMALVSAER